MTYDVAVIGAGIVGSAIARELAGHDLTVALLDARNDVGDGTSKANTAILHTGFDAKPGSLESGMVREGYWSWPGGGRYEGVPASNFLGWFATGAVVFAVWVMGWFAVKRLILNPKPPEVEERT